VLPTNDSEFEAETESECRAVVGREPKRRELTINEHKGAKRNIERTTTPRGNKIWVKLWSAGMYDPGTARIALAAGRRVDAASCNWADRGLLADRNEAAPQSPDIAPLRVSESGNRVWGSPGWEQNHGLFEQQLFSLPMPAV
jgi:hypothetical protein